MKLIPLNCRQCSAPLNVPENVLLVTCLHCGSQLAVVQEGTTVYTESCDQEQNVSLGDAVQTKEMDCQLIEESRQQRELAALDHEWKQMRRRYMLIDADGNACVPSSDTANNMAIITIVSGVLWILPAWIITDNWSPFLVLCLLIGVFVVIGLGLSRLHYQRAVAYHEAKRCYLRRRLEVTEVAEAYPTKGWG